MSSNTEGTAEPLAVIKTGYPPVENPAGGLSFSRARIKRARDGIWPRIGFLFAVLCLIKFFLLVVLRKHLFEIHWRVSGEPYNWMTEAGFYGFAGLVGLHLWRLGTTCMISGRRTVRAANLCVLILGGVFILLTFHEGDKNYLSPVMNSVLSWKDLKWYLILNLFFRSPYLAAWIAAYGFIYYGLVRTGREQLVLRVTALCAAAYLALYLSDLTNYHSALIITDCVGVACLLSAGRSRQALEPQWIALFLLAAGLVFGLFHGLDPRLDPAQMNPEFVLLTGVCLVLLTGLSVLAWRLGFFTGWSWGLPFAFAAFLLFVNVRYGPAPNYNKLMCEGFTLSRYFLGELAAAGMLFVAARLYRSWRPTGSLWWLDILSIALIVLALADLRLSQIMGIRLDWPALSLALGETPKMMWRMAEPYLPALLGALLIVVGIYAAILQVICRAGGQREISAPRGHYRGAGFLLVSFVLLGVAGGQLSDQDKAEGQSALLLAETSPLWRRAVDRPMDRKAFVETAQRLGMNQLIEPRTMVSRPRRDLNVVLVFQESTYNKYLSLFNGREETEPQLSRYKDRMEIFPNFYSSFASSIHARFATFTGLYPGRDYKDFTIRHVAAKSIFELLHEQGYSCSLFYSSFLDYTGFRDFLKHRELDAVYDADTMPGTRKTKPVSWGLREEETLAAMEEQIKTDAANGRKFFLTYVPAAPHNPFDGTPAAFRKHKIENVGDFTPVYLNELLYLDWVIASLVDQLKASGVLDHTLVIITGDHGEMLGANGTPIGHGWAVTPELANVPLVIMDPGNPGYHINNTVGSQVDLPLTILDLLGLPVPPQQLSQGDSLYSGSAQTNRTIYLNSMRQYGVLMGTNMICGERGARDEGRVQSLFTMTNQENRTFYTVIPDEGTNPPPLISAFDRFQENLLRHYSDYCQVVNHP